MRKEYEDNNKKNQIEQRKPTARIREKYLNSK